jgi:hypothetical protein
VRRQHGIDGGRHDIEADAEEERAHDVDSAVVREADGEAPAVDTTVVDEVLMVQ